MNKGSATTALVIGVITITIPTFFLFWAVTFLFVVPLALGSLSIALGLMAYRSDSNLAGHAGWIAFGLLLMSFFIPSVMISHHNSSGYPIVYVVPNDFRGQIKLVIDRQNGVDVRLINGKYTYFIPDDGLLSIKSDSPFCRWHTMTAFYTNGQTLPIVNMDGYVPPDVVSLHSMGSGSTTQNGIQEEYIRDFVGTKEEYEKHVR